VDAMPEGGVIRLVTRVEGNVAVIDVTDTGIGMTEDERRRCFEPFFSTKGERGTGLGLASAFGTVRRLNGTITVDSTLGKGTTFTIRLPTSTALDEQEAPQESAAAVVPLRVCLVEDDPLVRELIASFLTTDGHSVDTAENGRQGLALFAAGSYDLVVTDRAMPIMSGDQLAAEIRRVDTAVPIILISGFGDIMEATGDLPAGVTLVVAKPVTLRAFREAIADACRLS
jgi:CheY-like chemotaxis protein